MNKKNQENILTITFIFDNGYSSYISYLMYLTQNHSKMKTKSNIALEGTCSGNVAGGLLLWTGENLQALLFLKGGYMEKEFHIRGLNQVLAMKSIEIPADEWLIDLGKELVEFEKEQALENHYVDTIRQNAGQAIDELYAVRSRITVIAELFDMKDREDGNSLFHGLVKFNGDVLDHLQGVIDMIEEVEGCIHFCKVDSEKIEAHEKKMNDPRMDKALADVCEGFKRMEKAMDSEGAERGVQHG